VCKALGVEQPHKATGRLDDDEKQVVGRDVAPGILNPGQNGGAQSTTIINESGLYSLILSSRKPEAKPFKKWVTSEVLPTIRKTGSYGAPAQLSGPELMAAALIEANQTLQQAQLQIAQQDAQLRTQAPLVESYRAHYSMEEVENFDAFADRWGFKNGPLTQVCEERGYLSKASKYRPNDVSLEPGEEPTAELGIFRSKRVKTGTGDNQKQRVHATIICGKSPDLARLVLYRFGRDAFAKPKRKSDTRQTDKFNELCAELKAMRDDGYEFDNRLITGMQVHPDIGYWAEHGTIEGVDDLGQVELQTQASPIRATPPHFARGLGTGPPRRHGQTKAYPPCLFQDPTPAPSTPDRGREPSYTPPDPRVTRILGNQSALIWLAGTVGGSASSQCACGVHCNSGGTFIPSMAVTGWSNRPFLGGLRLAFEFPRSARHR
jgi:prophage antirepressor-like protein